MRDEPDLTYTKDAPTSRAWKVSEFNDAPCSGGSSWQTNWLTKSITGKSEYEERISDTDPRK